MPSIIVFNDGDETSIHASDKDRHEAARLIAARFEGLSTDNETTRVVDGRDDVADVQYSTVEMTCRDEEHDLVHCLDFTPAALRWALAQTSNDSWGESAVLKEAGVL